MPKLNRRKSIVIGTVTLGVLGAGFAGVASAGTVPWRHHSPAAAQQRPFAFGEGVRASRPWDGRHRPRPSGSYSMPPSTTAPTTAPTTVPPGTTPPTTPPTTTPPTTTPPATTPPTTTPPAGSTVIQQALDFINAARAKANDKDVKPYVFDASLIKVAESHANNMATGCGLSHKCPNEDELGPRFSSFGVQWNSIGENIGQGNAANNDASIVQNTNAMTQSMLNEGPGGGHHDNLMSKGFHRIGLAVVRDSSGKIWISQDFAN